MRRVVCCFLALVLCLSVVGCLGPGTPSSNPAPSVQPTENVQTPAPAPPSVRYIEPAGHWNVTYSRETWQPDPEDDSTLHHASLDCGLVLAGWPMGMEGPEAELFEMKEQQLPAQLGDYVFLRSILLAKSDEAPYTGEIAYYLSEGNVFAHIVLVLGKELHGKPEAVALCQQDAEAVVSTLSVE